MLTLLIAAAAAAAALAGSPAPATASRTVVVTTTDYGFAMPDTIAAGQVTFRIENHGHEAHHLTLVRLGQGHSLADLLAAFKAGGPPPAWAVFAGGPNAVDPGGTSLSTTLDLRPGKYAAICIIPSPDGVPHLMKGMSKAITVKGSATAPPLSAPDTITLTDYAYAFSRALAPGTHRVVVRNTGTQPHELAIARPAPGKHAADVARWIEHMQGPPPAHFLGGVSPIAPGQSNVLTLVLDRGAYAFLCFVPDAKDGKPHVAHGMMKDVVVRK
jgi:uncharacterized cupredoxin-like copper-binding protein